MCELCCYDITREGPSCQWDLSNKAHRYTVKHWWALYQRMCTSCEGHTPAGHTVPPPPTSLSHRSLCLSLSLSLHATCTVYRTISCASGLFNVVIQAEHNCVPSSDRRLRTSSLLTKSPPHRGEARPTSGKKSFSVLLLLLFRSSFSLGAVKRRVQRIMAVLSLCKRGMGTLAKCLAFCGNEEKSKRLFHCGICTGTVHDH